MADPPLPRRRKGGRREEAPRPQTLSQRAPAGSLVRSEPLPPRPTSGPLKSSRDRPALPPGMGGDLAGGPPWPASPYERDTRKIKLSLKGGPEKTEGAGQRGRRPGGGCRAFQRTPSPGALCPVKRAPIAPGQDYRLPSKRKISKLHDPRGFCRRGRWEHCRSPKECPPASRVTGQIGERGADQGWVH